MLNHAAEREEEVEADSEQLMVKLTANRNLERSLDRAQGQTIAPAEKESRLPLLSTASSVLGCLL